MEGPASWRGWNGSARLAAAKSHRSTHDHSRRVHLAKTETRHLTSIISQEKDQSAKYVTIGKPEQNRWLVPTSVVLIGNRSAPLRQIVCCTLCDTCTFCLRVTAFKKKKF